MHPLTRIMNFLDVFGEVVFLVKGFITNVTLELPQVHVVFHVVLQLKHGKIYFM